LFDGVAECAEHGGGVHGASPDNIAVMPRERGIQYSRALNMIRDVTAYWIVRIRGR
jgi:hypothetical protein